MVKIKVEKGMSKQEFAEFFIKNAEFKNISVECEKEKPIEHILRFQLINKEIEICHLGSNAFIVEYFETITEDTVIPMLIEVTEYNDDTTVFLNENKSIKTVLDDSLDDLLYVPKAFYMLNEDMTMTLLWKGGMVE